MVGMPGIENHTERRPGIPGIQMNIVVYFAYLKTCKDINILN